MVLPFFIQEINVLHEWDSVRPNWKVLIVGWGFRGSGKQKSKFLQSSYSDIFPAKISCFLLAPICISLKTNALLLWIRNPLQKRQGIICYWSRPMVCDFRHWMERKSWQGGRAWAWLQLGFFKAEIYGGSVSYSEHLGPGKSTRGIPEGGHGWRSGHQSRSLGNRERLRSYCGDREEGSWGRGRCAVRGHGFRGKWVDGPGKIFM